METVKKDKSAVHEIFVFLYISGIFYAMSIVGPAIGYLLGGYLLEFYCDFDVVDTSL